MIAYTGVLSVSRVVVSLYAVDQLLILNVWKGGSHSNECGDEHKAAQVAMQNQSI